VRSWMRRLAAVLLLVLPAAAAPKAQEIVKGEIGAKLDRHVQGLDLCGSVLVARKGEILLNKGYGAMDEKGTPMRADAMWDWASASKQFTAAAILKLEMMKKLSLDDSIRKHWKDAPKDKQPVTIRHLLNHTSGIRQDEMKGVDHRDRDAVVRHFLSLPVSWNPGSKWEYSNLAYWVLGALIEKLSGDSYEKFCVEKLFRPAGMEDACFIGWKDLDLARVPKDKRGKGVHFAYGYEMSWGYRGSGGAVVSLEEMLLWDRALKGDKILSNRAKERMYEVGKNDYACGWFVDKSLGGTIYRHSGRVGETSTAYLRWIDEDIVVALARSEIPTEHPDETAKSLAAMVRNAK
ncbi:MAG: serine hydrolase domain-containing protein, partial [Planctomycetota bacterium]